MFISSSDAFFLDGLFGEILLRAGCAMIAIDKERNCQSTGQHDCEKVVVVVRLPRNVRWRES